MLQLVNVSNIYADTKIPKPENAATIVVNNIEIFIPLTGLIDVNIELDRLKNKMQDLEKRINNVKNKLDNKNFIERAPKDVVAHEQSKYDSYLKDYNKLKTNFDNLNKEN